MFLWAIVFEVVWLGQYPSPEQRTKIAGAIQHCNAKKLTKQCPYEKVKKYLVLTSDKVEQLFWFR